MLTIDWERLKKIYPKIWDFLNTAEEDLDKINIQDIIIEEKDINYDSKDSDDSEDSNDSEDAQENNEGKKVTKYLLHDQLHPTGKKLKNHLGAILNIENSNIIYIDLLTLSILLKKEKHYDFLVKIFHTHKLSDVSFDWALIAIMEMGDLKDLKKLIHDFPKLMQSESFLQESYTPYIINFFQPYTEKKTSSSLKLIKYLINEYPQFKSAVIKDFNEILKITLLDSHIQLLNYFLSDFEKNVEEIIDNELEKTIMNYSLSKSFLILIKHFSKKNDEERKNQLLHNENSPSILSALFDKDKETNLYRILELTDLENIIHSFAYTNSWVKNNVEKLSEWVKDNIEKNSQNTMEILRFFFKFCKNDYDNPIVEMNKIMDAVINKQVPLSFFTFLLEKFPDFKENLNEKIDFYLKEIVENMADNLALVSIVSEHFKEKTNQMTLNYTLKMFSNVYNISESIRNEDSIYDIIEFKHYVIFTEYFLSQSAAQIKNIEQYIQIENTILKDQKEDIQDLKKYYKIRNLLNNKEIIEEYKIFSKKYNKLNKNNMTDYTFLTYFLFLHANSLSHLYKIFNNYKKFFEFLNGFMANSTLFLDRFLAGFKINDKDILETSVYIFSQNLKFNHEKTKNILLLLSLINNFKEREEKSSLKNNYPILNEIKKLKKIDSQKVLNIISDFAIELYFNELSIPFEKNISAERVQKIIPLEFLVKLLHGRNQLKNDEYITVFDELIKINFTHSLSFNEFISQEKQDSIIGSQLAIHNNKIDAELIENGIKIDLAHHYSNEVMIRNEVYRVLNKVWNDIINLDNALKNHGSKNKEILTLQKNITNFKTQILKQIKKDDKFNEKKLPPLIIDKIMNEDKILILKKICNTKLTEEKDYDTTLINYFIKLKKSINSLTNEEKKKIYQSQKSECYTIKQWDKSSILTLLLGNYLSCCLATDGNQFNAMLQRWMDKAMFMHVIIDENSQEPICGNWLFFAKNTTNGDIYVVANFFEIRMSYNQNNENDIKRRNLFINKLIDFTGTFAKKIGAKKFLMRPLTYGSIPDLNNYGYQLIDMEIEKVGGYLNLTDENENSLQEEYYLKAIDCREFYDYDTKKKFNLSTESNYSLQLFTTKEKNMPEQPTVKSKNQTFN